MTMNCQSAFTVSANGSFNIDSGNRLLSLSVDCSQDGLCMMRFQRVIYQCDLSLLIAVSLLLLLFISSFGDYPLDSFPRAIN
jgi:hypothetical protein